MKSCPDVDAIMTAYVDGEVAPDESTEVRAHLVDCPPCRERASAESTARVVLQAKAATLGERAPAALRAQCVASTPVSVAAVGKTITTPRWQQRVGGWVPLSLAATALLAVGTVFVVGQNQRLEAAFAAQLALDHDRCFAHLDDITPDFDQQQAEAALAGDHGLAVGMPAESADFDLINVRRCLYDEGDMTHVLCEWRGQPVSLFVVPDRPGREQVLEIIGHDAVIWFEGDNNYVLVAAQGPVEIGQVVEYVRQDGD